MDKLVSIIIPCYNDATYIEQAVNSAIGQNYPYKEIIIVDDGSNLETKKVLKNLEHKIDLLITQENKGPSSARNVGIQNSSGEFILVLDSDDYFDTKFCDLAIKSFEENLNIKMVTCYARWFWDDNNFQLFKPEGGTIQNFLFKNSSLGTIFRKQDWKEVLGYDENMRNGFEDWEFYIRILKNGGIAYVIPEVLFHYRKKHVSRTTYANKNKYSLIEYVYLKHSALYKENFEIFAKFLLNKIEAEEKEKIKNINRLEFKIGKAVLKPLRYFKQKLYRY